MDSLWTYGLLVPKSGGTSYLLRDLFTTNRAAGAINGTLAEPGGTGSTAQKTRTVVDTESKESIAGQTLILMPKAAPAWGDPGLWYGAITRREGLRLEFELSVATPGNNTALVGFDDNQSGIIGGHGVNTGSELRLWGAAADTFAAGTWTPGSTYQFAIVLRATGAYLFVKGNDYTNWTLLAIASTSTTTTLYPAIANYNAVTLSVSYIRIPHLTWLPTPLAYDTFTRADGAIGSSQANGPDGQIVQTRVWTAQSGTWAISSNTAVATAAGVATLPSLGNGDYIIQTKVTTPGSGTTAGGILVRYTDADNYWYIKVIPGTAGNDFFLIERNGGSESIRAQADIDWATSTQYIITIVCSGDNDWRVFQNNTQKLTYSDTNPFNATATIIGLKDEGNSNLIFDDILVFPRGTAGEYAGLGSNQDQQLIVGFGDSVTSGSGATTEDDRWLNIVRDTLGWGVLVNSGAGGTPLQNTIQNSVVTIGGAVAANGRDNYISRIINHNPDWVLILYGLNDLRLNDVAFTVANFQNDLGEVVDGIIAAGTPANHIVLASPSYMNPAMYASYAPWDGGSTAKHEQHRDAVAAVATAKGTRYIDVYQWMLDNGGNALLDAGGIHPNDAGHQAIADAFLSVL